MRIVRSAGDCELARRTARVDAVVAVDGVEELRRRIDDLPVAAWLPAPSTERAAELLELGVDEVLDGAMGERELSARVSRLPPGAGAGVEQLGRLPGGSALATLVAAALALASRARARTPVVA